MPGKKNSQNILTYNTTHHMNDTVSPGLGCLVKERNDYVVVVIIILLVL